MTDSEIADIISAAEKTALPPVTHTLTFEKRVGRALDDDKSDIQLQTMMNSVLTIQRQRAGWSLAFEVTDPVQIWDDTHFGRDSKTGRIGRLISNRYGVDGTAREGFVYKVNLVATCRPQKARGTIGAEFDNIAAALAEKGAAPAVRWNLEYVDGHTYIPTEKSADGEYQVDPNEQIGYVPFEMPSDEDWWAGFDHLYGLDDYISVIKATLEAAIDSQWSQRTNIALIGPPACGKSDICKSLKKVLGEHAVLEYDATSTTMAGAQADLDQREELPRVLLIEEIEKADPASLSWLLSVLDLRGEIRKTTARGEILKEIHMIGICTVNSEDVFDRLQSGALSSRFAMPLQFERPTRDVLHLILAREVKKVGQFELTKDGAICDVCQNPLGGAHRWIEPTLDLAQDMNTTDPRRVIAFCLTGRDGLVNGDYQRKIKRIMRPDTRFAPVQMKRSLDQIDRIAAQNRQHIIISQSEDSK